MQIKGWVGGKQAMGRPCWPARRSNGPYEMRAGSGILRGQPGLQEPSPPLSQAAAHSHTESAAWRHLMQRHRQAGSGLASLQAQERRVNDCIPMLPGPWDTDRCYSLLPACPAATATVAASTTLHCSLLRPRWPLALAGAAAR